MKRSWGALLALAFLLEPRSARAVFEQFERDDKAEKRGETPCDDSSDYANGLGSDGRAWELDSETAISTNRYFTQRFEIAHAFEWPRHPSVDFILRVGFGSDAYLNSGLYGIQGALPSFGILDRSESGNFWIEFGVRLLVPWIGPHDKDPNFQALALGSTLTSGLGDDAAWLPFSNAQLQWYITIQSRTNPVLMPGWSWFAGVLYGAKATFGTVQVTTWLGPENQFVGNAFVELFLGFPRISTAHLNGEAGLHADASLSNVWPGVDPFPAVGDVFVSWSPRPWISARIFYGIAGSPSGNLRGTQQYGTRLQFYLP